MQRLALLLFVLLAPLPAGAQSWPVVRWVAAGHVGVSSVDVASQGGIIASGSLGDHTIKLWSADGTFLRTLAAHVEGLNAVRFSPDGTLLATGGGTAWGSGDVNVKIWRVADGGMLRTLGAPDGPAAQSLAWTPDGSRVVIGRDNGSVEIRLLADGSLERSIDAHSWSVFGVDVSPDGTLVASCSGDHLAKLWRIADGSLAGTLTGHSFFVSGVRFSPDGTRIATGSWDMTARIWDVATSSLVRTITGDPDAINAIDWSPDGTKLATGDAVSQSNVWDVSSGALVRSMTDSTVQSAIQSVRFEATGMLLAGGSDGKTRRWDPATGAKLATFGHHSGRVSAVTFTSDGRVVSGSNDFVAKVFRQSDGAKLLDLVGHDDVINAVSVARGDAIVATAAGSPPPDTRDPTIKLWSLSDGSLIRTLPGHPGGSFCAAFSPDGSVLASGGNDGLVRLWRTSDGGPIRTLSHAGAVLAVAWTPDGAWLVTSDGAELTWWNPNDGTFVRSVPTTSAVVSLAMNDDCTLVAGALSQYGDNVATWRVADGSLDRTFGGHVSFAQSVAFVPGTTTLLSTSGFDADLRAWDATDGSLRWIVNRECGWGPMPLLVTAVSPDGSRVAWGRHDATLVVASFGDTITIETRCADGTDDDGDGPIDCADSDCIDAPNCDRDGDGEPNATDCDPADPAVIHLPGEVPLLMAAHRGADLATLTWTDLAPTFGTTTTSDVVTGLIRELWSDRGCTRASCLAQRIASPAIDDPRALPGPSDGWYYLCRARDACGEGPYGVGSFGSPRDLDANLCR